MPQRKNPFRPVKLNFAEQFFPARPVAMLQKARKIARSPLDAAKRLGPPSGLNGAYVSWLKKESMLYEANLLAKKYSGKGRMWQNPFAKPRPRTAVRRASVWYAAYPASLITKDKESILATLGDEELWKAFQTIGIQALHTGPMKRAGGVSGWDYTPSVDGHYDRISTKIDTIFGTEAEYRHMTEVASQHGGLVMDDIVPGHTGKGADFRLAEMNYGDYPGIYHMVEIHPGDWHLLPQVPKGRDSVNIDHEAEAQLKQRGYIIGKLHRVMFYEPGVKETNWSATRVIKGVDGTARRWVYLHYFKEGQPSLNWLDPSFAGMKLVIGDSLHSLGELGSKGLRLDANGFLGIEKGSEDQPAWSEGHPLSEAANMLIAGMVRKLGGFTFQEVNLSIDDLKIMGEAGADLSYDFVNRPAYHHALAMADTEFLRIMMRYGLEIGVDPASLVHALQNHDELTYELVHFWTIHKDDIYTFRDRQVKGFDLRLIIRQDMLDKFTGEAAPYNLPFTENGIACTTASVITAVLGYRDISNLTPKDIDKVKRVHMLLAMFNALQPGVFALSGWDLCGSLTIDPDKVRDMLGDGDTRWINRSAYDMMGRSPQATHSTGGLPRAVNLYGTLPEQLADEDSFANQLKRMLAMRDQYSIATSHQIDIPEIPDRRLLVMVHRLPDELGLQVTVLNFSADKISSEIFSKHLPSRAVVLDMMSGKKVADVSSAHVFTATLEPYEGRSFLISA